MFSNGTTRKRHPRAASSEKRPKAGGKLSPISVTARRATRITRNGSTGQVGGKWGRPPFCVRGIAGARSELRMTNVHVGAVIETPPREFRKLGTISLRVLGERFARAARKAAKTPEGTCPHVPLPPDVRPPAENRYRILSRSRSPVLLSMIILLPFSSSSTTRS